MVESIDPVIAAPVAVLLTGAAVYLWRDWLGHALGFKEER